MPVALGIDFGKARIGVAATDDLRLLASPVETVRVADGNPIERIAEIVAERGATTVVVGLPLRMDGSEGTAAADVREFISALEHRLPGIDFVEVDERLTTREAQQLLEASGRKATRENRDNQDIIDQAAAVLILQDYLDQQVPGQDAEHDLSFDLGLGAFDEDFD